MNIARPLAVPLAITALASSIALATAFGPVIPPRPMSELVPQSSLHLGKTADWVAITPDAVWVGSTGPYAVHRIDPLNDRRVASVKLPGEPCGGLATGFDSLWVPLCGKVPKLARIDLHSNRLTALFKVGPSAPEGGITTSDEGVWLVLDRRGKLARIDPVSGRVSRVVQVPPGSYNPRFADGRIWVTRAEGAELTAVDAASGTVVSSTPTGPGPRFLAVGSDAVWTLNQGDGSVSAIDVHGAQVRQNVALGIPGRGGDIAVDGGVVWTTMPKVPLSAVDSASGKVICQWTGTGGDSLAVGHGAVWLTDYNGGTISRLPLDELRKHCTELPAP